MSLIPLAVQNSESLLLVRVKAPESGVIFIDRQSILDQIIQVVLLNLLVWAENATIFSHGEQLSKPFLLLWIEIFKSWVVWVDWTAILDDKLQLV